MNHACKMLGLVCVLLVYGSIAFAKETFSFSRLPDGSLMEITKVYPLDAVFDNPEDVPEDVMDISNYFQFCT